MKLRKIVSLLLACIMSVTVFCNQAFATVDETKVLHGYIDEDDYLYMDYGSYLIDIDYGFNQYCWSDYGITQVVVHAKAKQEFSPDFQSCFLTNTSYNWANNTPFNQLPRTTFGGVDSNSDVIVSSAGDFDVSVPITFDNRGSYEISFHRVPGYSDNVTINSIEFLSGSKSVCSWKRGDQELTFDGMYPNQLYCQTAGYDEDTNTHLARYVELLSIEEDSVNNCTSVEFNFHYLDWNKTVVSKKCYKSITSCGSTLIAPKGFVYVCYVVTDIPNSIEAEDISCELNFNYVH